MILSLDTETTGTDIFHGCRPYSFPCLDSDGNEYYWEWDVNPFTREPKVNLSDIEEIVNLLDRAEKIVFHNAKFDIRCMESVGVSWEPYWHKTHDTIIASHCYRNLWRRGLKPLSEAILYIGDDDEEELKKACVRARTIGRNRGYRIHLAGDAHSPAQKGKGSVKADTWLPRACLVNCPDCNDFSCEFCSSHKDWLTAAKKYANLDATRTLLLWFFFEEVLQLEKTKNHINPQHFSDYFDLYGFKFDDEFSGTLRQQYEIRRLLLPITYKMQNRGVDILEKRLQVDRYRYRKEKKFYFDEAKTIAHEVQPELTKVTSQKQVTELLFSKNRFGVIPKFFTKKGNPAISKDAIKYYRTALPEEHGANRFLNALVKGKAAYTAINYLDGYQAWKVKNGCNGTTRVAIHPGVNITGTRFTRQSSTDPNIQNVSNGKKDEDTHLDLFNLRRCFGPAKNRVWWDFDYKNLELRLWAYGCGNKDMIACFENDISVHLLIARELFPKLRKMSDKEASSTAEYKRTKNGNFASVYGGGPSKIDMTYGVPGASQKIDKRFPEKKAFTDKLHEDVARQGYIETLGGYRLYIPRNEPHKAVSGFIQGTAGYIIMMAMIGCDGLLSNYNKSMEESNHAYMTIQVHDQLVFDVPEHEIPLKPSQIIKEMEKPGELIGIPTPVDGELIKQQWSKAEGFAN